MAKENKVATVNNQNEMEVKEMANNVQQQEAPVVEQQATTPVAAPAQQQVPAEVPVEETQKTFWDKHPKVKKVADEGKKWGKRLALLAAIGGGIFAAKKWGEAVGFDKATDAYNNRQSGDNPEPDENPDDLGDAEFEELHDEE